MMMMIIERNVPLSTITLLFIWNYFNQSLGGLWYYTLHNISDAKSIVNLLYVLLCLDRPRNKQRYQFYQYPLDCHPPSFVQLPWQTWKLNNNNKKFNIKSTDVKDNKRHLDALHFDLLMPFSFGAIFSNSLSRKNSFCWCEKKGKSRKLEVLNC